MISKSISTSRKINKLSDRASLIYTWMIPHTDDFGHLEGDPLSIRAKVVPMREISLDEIEGELKEMETVGVITRYEVEGEKYIEINGFEDFQTFKTDRPRRQEYPQRIQTESSRKPVVSKRKPSGNIVRRKLSEVKLSEDKKILVPEGTSLPETPKKPRGGKGPKPDDDDPYTREEFVAKMRESKQPHVLWLADYAEEKKPSFKTKGQWRGFFERNVKGAAQIRKYSDEQIEKAYEMLTWDLRANRKNPKGFITKWGIETIIKYLDELTDK